MATNDMTRRGFLAGTSAAAAAMTAPAVLAQSSSGSNDRISIGVIGVGGRGSALMNEIKQQADKHNVEITAVCDVWQVNLNNAASKVKDAFGKEPRKFTRFGDLIALKDVDAVVIATPDFGHTPIMIEALKADKDVYVEKPMAMEIDHANTALRLARERNRVVQTGTQRRSDGVHPIAARHIRKGVLGHISRVSAERNFNHPRWLRGYDNCKKEDVDWDAYLFNRPQAPFDPRWLRQWHLYKMFTNGLSGLWMSHYIDVLHMLIGDDKYPLNAVTNGGTYVWKQNRHHCDTFHTLMEYPGGLLWSWGMGLANGAGSYFRAYGMNGTLDIDRMKITGDGGAGKDKIEEPIQLPREHGESHMGNWLECLRSRKRPNADIKFGHMHSVATILAAKALHTGKRQEYDAKTSTVKAV